jgi:hypothetical protein
MLYAVFRPPPSSHERRATRYERRSLLSFLPLLLHLPRIFFYPKCSLSPTPLFTCSPIRCTLYADRYPSRAIKCARVCRKFEYFQIFSNVSHQFSNIFKRFALLFNRFRIFSNTTCAFGRAFIFPRLPNRYNPTPLPSNCRDAYLRP